MGSLQVEKQNAEKFVQQSSEQHLTKNGTDQRLEGSVCLTPLMEILDFNTKATRTHILEK